MGIVPWGEGGIMDGLPGEILGLGDRPTVFVFRLNIQELFPLIGELHSHGAVGGVDGFKTTV